MTTKPGPDREQLTTNPQPPALAGVERITAAAKAAKESTVPVIEVRALVKTYGRIEALKGVTLSVYKGEIFGLLGQNGAGKTTLVKILLGITRPTDGLALLLDEPAGTAVVRSRVGYLPEDHRFPDYHTGYSLMDFYGELLGLSGAERKKRIPDMLELVGL